MDNNIFINKLIDGTKDNKLSWSISDDESLFRKYSSYQLKKQDKVIQIEKFETIEYDGYGEELHGYGCKICICDGAYKKLSEILEDDLKVSSSLMRLYRLVERQANKVDDIMELFVKDIEDDFNF